MHPELTYAIAKVRRDELLRVRRFPRPAPGVRRPFFRRHRDAPAATVGLEPSTIVLLPPPRDERDPAGHAQRVA